MPNPALNMVQNVWDNLTTLSEKDPEKYSEIVRQSAEDVKKAKTLPIPQFCLKTRTDQFADFHINILSWDRVAKSTSKSAAALPMCGGKLDSPAERVAHIAVNPDNIPGSSLNASSDFGLICLDFIEHVNPGLKFLRQVEVVKDTKHLGDLASIQEYFQNLGLANTMRPGRPTLVTDSPSALLKRISSPLPVETGNELESENSSSIHLPLMRRADSSDTKPLVEEYKPGGNPKPDDRKSDDFSRKLKDAFLREEEKAAAKKKEKKEVQGSIKLREEECFLKPVSTRVVRRNQLIWGRSVQNKDDESLAASTISIKVYLPGVHRIENILFSISEVNFTLQTASGGTLEINIYPEDEGKRWTLQSKTLRNQVMTLIFVPCAASENKKS